ncbi:MAG: hypothetical protein A2980_00725 [Candidatus Staskawiczbacteria bacterium RIFCSPLOWO2_01_FULL_33_13]|nr:MAG: hypothetical protein A2980_00725 [Candidatus Staskawiczbacteria bacterium RIFCSPLOWO2_01_FULL_33_13]
MLEIRFTQKAIIDVEVFIRNYEESFLQLYSDSGIWSESVIKDMYIKSANELHEKIIDGIVEKLHKKKVLGRKETGLMIEIDFYIGSRLIIVLFSDNHRNSIRQVESIFIDRKPIIF